MTLVGTIPKVLAAAKKLGSSGGNEANTKALLIEPLLASLGWDTADLDQVEREYRVYDGTSLDYALKIQGVPHLFLEAKAVGKALEDKAFISQTVNYANNEGVLWCVLTNGLAYRVYKTNEPVNMEEKLLFEVDISEAEGGSATEVAGSLELISRDSLASAALDTWGEQVFTDKRVRDALVDLAAKPPPDLLSLLASKLGKPEVSSPNLTESLVRILDVGQGGTPPVQSPKGKKPRSPPSPTPRGKEYSLEHHLGGKSSAMVDLFEKVDEYGRSLGPTVSRRVRKQYVGYFAGKRSFFTAEVQRQRIILYLNLDPTSGALETEEAFRDVRKIGHFGMGDTEYSLRNPSQVEEAKALVRQAFEETK